MDLQCKITCTKVGKGEIAIFWLGQAGFVIKDSDEKVIAVDPYLTDCCERIYGFKRLTPKLIAPHELEPDVLITTHHHEDHFDVDAVPIIMSSLKVKLIGSKTVVNKCIDMGIDREKLAALEAGDEIKVDDIAIKAVYADHGDLAPDAIGVLLEIKGIKLYFAGDTAYRPEKMQKAIDFKPDIAILPINGAYGNLNAVEAAKLARDTKAKVAIPCHFWTFKIHRGDPQDFEDEMRKYAPDCMIKFMCQGEMFKYKCL